jgi:tetratricopeptide (TPR) repeat protein
VTHSAEHARDAFASARPVLEGVLRNAAPGGLSRDEVRSAWDAVLRVLRALVPEHTAADAKAMVGALRQGGLCTLDEAHGLIDLHALAVRLDADPTGTAAAGDLPRQLVATAMRTLERIVQTAGDSTDAAPLYAEYTRAASPPPPLPPPPPQAERSVSPPPARTTGGGRSSAFVVGLVVVCLVAAGVAAVLFTRIANRDAMSEGVTAYQAGQRVAARIAFEQALANDPSDARPLVFLGRLSREEGDLAQARRLLEQAVQRDPEYALAHRELAAALLADGQPELARRFYVRALTIDPTDRLAQGFLGCSLARLGRVEEARRWLDRAGPGDWVACANAAVPPVRP